jgi:hypothetical protein
MRQEQDSNLVKNRSVVRYPRKFHELAKIAEMVVW